MRAATVLASALVLACGAVSACADEREIDGSVPAIEDPALIERRDVPVGELTEMDVFGVARATDVPTVVLLHGTAGDRTRLHPLARELASRGTVVFVPSWPVIEEPGAARGDSQRFRVQVEAVVCALQTAVTETAAYGGDPDDLTVVGYSGGASVGATASLAVEPPGCRPGIDHEPTRFIGIAGDYHGEYQGGPADAAAYVAYDPFAIEPSRRVEVRTLHGLDDRVVNAYVSGEFVDHLTNQGVDARLLVTGSGHAEMIDPESEAGTMVADQIDALVHRRPSAFDVDATVHASLSFDARSCSYTGPESLDAGDLVELELRNLGSTPATFGLLSASSEIDRTLLEAPTEPVYVGSVGRFGLTVSNRPSWIVWGGFRIVGSSGAASWRWAVTDGDVAWLPVCFVDEPGHELHGLIVRGTDPTGSMVVIEIG